MAYSRSHANRGKKLEMLLEMTNNQYRNGNVADIRKVPTPVDILKVTGNKVQGKLGKASWVDYNGIYQGQSIVFEAKESTIERWPLDNMTDDQYAFLKSWHTHGAITFVIVAFWLKGKNEPEIYSLFFKQLEQAWVNKAGKGPKSIPLKFFREHCIKLGSARGFVIDYLGAIFNR